jgi:hypothetical protein
MLFLTVAAKTAQHAEIEVLVALRVPDRVALTARRALTERLGYEGILTDLTRENYYRLAVTGTEAEANAYVEDMIKNTAVFANPNKEIYTVAPLRRPLRSDGRHTALVYPRRGFYDEAFLKQLVWGLKYERVIAAARGIAWTLTLAPGVDESHVERILVTRSRAQGLLLNPHAEQYELA